jgi:hypothetical protein
MAVSTVLCLKRVVRDDNSSLVLVLPYMTADCANNRVMVDRSNLVICCIERKAGRTYQTIRYAEKKGKCIVNIADVPW